MRFHCGKERPVFQVSQPKLVGCLPHDRSDPGIMNVADLGEQMVLDLKVKPTDIPAQPLVARGEIDCRLQLVYGPVLFDNPVFN